MWLFNCDDIEKILQIIEQHKTTFILALGGDTLRNILQIEDDVSRIFVSIQQYHNRKESPGKQNLIKTLFSLFSGPDQFYILLNVIDECTEMEDLIKLIVEILQYDVSVLVTSRKE